MRIALTVLAAYVGLSVFLVLLWLVLGVLGAVELPDTLTKWLWLLVLAVPVHVAGELIGHVLSNNRAARFVEQKTEGKRLSLLRMLYAFLVILLSCGAILGAAYVWKLLRG